MRVLSLLFWLIVSSKFHSTFMVLLLCVAFVGQAVASNVMAYHMLAMKSMNVAETSHSMPMMDHSHHAMMSETSDNTNSETENCCYQTCECFTGSCTSAIALLNDSGSSAFINTFDKTLILSTSLQNQSLKSLYRPPIFG